MMSKFRIPKSFQLFGKTYRVSFRNEVFDDEGRPLLGQVRCQEQIIRLLKTSSTVTQQSQDHTFLHEMVHAILYEIGEKKRFDDEKFVDVFANALYQALTTAK
jgi:E3 ubiquitin-protein ligase DOA10